MAHTDARIEPRAGVARALWSSRNRILASTAALSAAALLAGQLVPPVHRASVRLVAPPAVSGQWDATFLQRIVATGPAAGEGRPPGVVATWIDLVDHAAAVRPETGAERRADGSVEVWAVDRDIDVARARAIALSDRITDRTSPARAVTPPATPPATAGNAPLEALDRSIAEAQDSLAAAEVRLAATAASRSPQTTNSTGTGSADPNGRAVATARRELEAVERFSRNLAGASPADAPAAIRDTEEWRDWRNARIRRDATAAQMTELSRTLLDGHPRMATVRLRLADLDDDLRTARDRLAATLRRRADALRREVDLSQRGAAAAADSRNRQEAAAAERAEAEADVASAQRTLDALQEARASAAAAAGEASPAPPATPEATPPEISTTLSLTEMRPNIWPIVAGSAAFGFLASSLAAILGTPRSRRRAAAPDIVVRGRRRRGAAIPDETAVVERRASAADVDITAADELIGGILASEISRVVILPVGADERPVAVEIVRRLALRGRQGALVDLSERQLAARAMGLAPEALGVTDMIAGEATFAEIARRDFATQAEAFGAGQAAIGEAAFLAMERRNVLEFIERNYEVVLVVCGGLPLETVKALLTPDAALVVTVDGGEDDAIADGVKRLREAGLADMILADGRQLAA